MVLFDENRPRGTRQDQKTVRQPADRAGRLALITLLSGQSAGVAERFELVVPQRPDLQADRLILVFADGDRPDELAHQSVAGVILRRLDMDRAAIVLVFLSPSDSRSG